MTENPLTVKNVKSSRYSGEIIRNKDSADNLERLVNTTALSKFLLHQLEKIADF